MEPETPIAAPVRRARYELGLITTLVVAIGAPALILSNSPLINGSSVWRWEYRADPAPVGWVILVDVIVTCLCVAALAARRVNRRGALACAFLLLGAAGAILRLATAWLFSERISLGFVGYVVENPGVGSYYAAARQLAGRPGLLRHYPEWMASLPLHAQNKPPGLVLLNLLFIDCFGDAPGGHTAAYVGVACGALSLASIPLCYAIVRTFGGSATAGFYAATLWAVSPGAAIFFPLADPMMTVPVLLMTVAWTMAIQRDRYAWSASMGGALAATLLLTLNVLPIGAFLVAIGLLTDPIPMAARARRFARHAAVAIVSAAAIHLALALLTGFDVLATARAALQNQAVLLHRVVRPWPDTVLWDLIEFALGVAWVPVALAAIYAAGLRRPRRPIDHIVLAGLAQLLITAASGLLQSETARVWNFLVPLILLPAALELERWPPWAPLIAFATMAGLTALMARSMIFMYGG